MLAGATPGEKILTSFEIDFVNSSLKGFVLCDLKNFSNQYLNKNFKPKRVLSVVDVNTFVANHVILQCSFSLLS